jgi:hypothetical protein
MPLLNPMKSGASPQLLMSLRMLSTLCNVLRLITFRLRLGAPSASLPVLGFILVRFSKHVHRRIVDSGYEACEMTECFAYIGETLCY